MLEVRFVPEILFAEKNLAEHKSTDIEVKLGMKVYWEQRGYKELEWHSN